MTFLAPTLLWVLLALPVLYILLRIIPPPVRREAFGGLALLQAVKPADTVKTRANIPWWLWLLRGLLLVALIVGFAEPVAKKGAFNIPENHKVLVIEDGGWASAPTWQARRDFVRRLVNDDISFLSLAVPDATPTPHFDAIHPQPWLPDRARLMEVMDNGYDTVIWMTDGYDYGDALPQGLLIVQPDYVENAVISNVRRTSATTFSVTVQGDADNIQAVDAAGRVLHTQAVTTSEEIEISLPVQVANQISHLRLSPTQTAAQVHLLDQRDKRALVGIATDGVQETVSPLLSEQHYLESAARLSQAVFMSTVTDLLDKNVDMILLPGHISVDAQALRTWMEVEGGWLVRFAAANMGAQNLLPIYLRGGARALESAFSWQSPKSLSPFPEDSPFANFSTDGIQVQQQVLADPTKMSTAQVWATLEDGTPLITAQDVGAGKLIFYHVAANAEWSTVPLSSLFPDMLRVLSRLSVSGEMTQQQQAETWKLHTGLTAQGELQPVEKNILIEAEAFAVTATDQSPPGFYRPLDASAARPHNLFSAEAFPLKRLEPPAGTQIYNLQEQTLTSYQKWFFLAAFVLFLCDVLVHGFIRRFIAMACVLAWMPLDSAQADDLAQAVRQTTLAYIKTGETSVDRLSQAGLETLGRTLTRRTSIEPGPPHSVTWTQDLRPYPVVYWPVTQVPPLTPDQTQNLSNYIAAGGFLIIDTQGTPFATLPLKALPLPALVPLEQAHVLHKTYYLLDGLAGRTSRPETWITPPGLDGTSALVLTNADWGGAWAQDEYGFPLLPMPYERQETALRTGVNLVMYAFTGTYKADQLHVRALLDRMGDNE